MIKLQLCLEENSVSYRKRKNIYTHIYTLITYPHQLDWFKMGVFFSQCLLTENSKLNYSS